jgi:RNase H-like domain found in reverse transcriptase
VAFLSKTFTDTERQYEIYDRELLGIVQALKEWRHYIQGSGHTTLIHMDHRNLTYFRKAQKLSDRQARWSLFLSKFDIKLQHLLGNKMILSDALSRRPDHCPEEDETKEEILLPNNLFLNLCRGSIQSFSGSDPKRFRLKTLTETPSSFLALDYLGPILGSSDW